MIQRDTNWASFYINDAISCTEARSQDPFSEPLVEVEQMQSMGNEVRWLNNLNDTKTLAH